MAAAQQCRYATSRPLGVAVCPALPLHQGRVRPGGSLCRGSTCRHAAPDDITAMATVAEQLIQHGPHAHAVLGSAPADVATNVPPHHHHQELRCTLSGLDNMQCVLEEVTDDESEPVGSSGSWVSPSTSATSSIDATTADLMGNPLVAKVVSAALLVSPFFFWGTSMVAMKGVVPHTTPLLLGALRLLPAGLVLLAWAASTGRAQPSTAQAWAWVVAFALVDAAAFQGFLAEGLMRTSAGMGSVIIDSQPLSVAVLAAVLFGEKLSPLGVGGLFLGVLGLGLLEVPGNDLAEASSLLLSGAWHPAMPTSLASLTESGEFWMLLAAQSMALGTVMVRYICHHVDPVIATAWHMVIGGALLVGIAAAAGVPELTQQAFPLAADSVVAAAAASAPALGPAAAETAATWGAGAAMAADFSSAAAAAGGADAGAAAAIVGADAVAEVVAPAWSHVGETGTLLLQSLQMQLGGLTATDALAMSYVSLLGGAASYGIFFWAASHGSLTSLSSLTFLTPVFASIAGYLALGEVLSPMQLVGGAVTLAAVGALNYKGKDATPTASASQTGGSQSKTMA